MGVTGARLKIADCLYTGLASHVVSAANTDAVIDRLASGATPDSAISGLAADAGIAPLIELSADIRRLFAAEGVEEILSGLEADNSEWSRNTAKILRTKSPTSLKIAHRQIREGAKLEFDECMRMEFRIVSRIIEGNDFFEGVRPPIIEKDGAPRWQPADLAGVSDAEIDAYFVPLGDKELKLE